MKKTKKVTISTAGYAKIERAVRAYLIAAKTNFWSHQSERLWKKLTEAIYDETLAEAAR